MYIYIYIHIYIYIYIQFCPDVEATVMMSYYYKGETWLFRKQEQKIHIDSEILIY